MREKEQRCWLYCRVDSSAGETSGQALDAQESELREYSEENGFLVAGVIRVRESGLEPHRPSTLQLIDTAAEHKMDLALACNLSRIARTSEGIWQIRKALNRRGVSIRSLVGVENTPTNCLFSAPRHTKL